ncbi:hypothetical protein D8674_004179 [Pyrus ussuriensis x Pyrus communis]|uniref:Uncharacterized protein n=1 Tax=Pyrus ussuriensis x Pyrus communis TaxID=2448454 RepID=A0A5N5FXZ6_9ROSA|nr:hypothetical protein D8674_004179 [Pyrus ussuriensis x Pyrus communis]
MDNAKQIEEPIEQRPEDDDDAFVDPPLASKKRKMEKEVAKKGPKAKKAKPSKQLVLQHEDPEKVETVVEPEQQKKDDDEITVSNVSKKGNDQTDNEEFQMTLSTWIIKSRSQDKLKIEENDALQSDNKENKNLQK